MLGMVNAHSIGKYHTRLSLTHGIERTPWKLCLGQNSKDMERDKA